MGKLKGILLKESSTMKNGIGEKRRRVKRTIKTDKRNVQDEVGKVVKKIKENIANIEKLINMYKVRIALIEDEVVKLDEEKTANEYEEYIKALKMINSATMIEVHSDMIIRLDEVNKILKYLIEI